MTRTSLSFVIIHSDKFHKDHTISCYIYKNKAKKLVKGVINMRNVFLLLICLIILSACHINKYSLPKDNPYLLISHVKEEMLSFVNLDRLELIEETPFPYQVHTIERIDQETILFTGKLEPAVRSLHLSTGEVNTLYEFGQGIMAMLFDEKERILYLADAKQDSVIFFDYDNKEILTSINVGSYPVDLTINDDRTELYVLASDDNEIYVIDIEQREVINKIPTLIGSTTLYFDGSYLWVGGHGMYRDLNEFINVYDPKTSELVTKIKVGSMPIFFHEETELDYIAVLCHGSHELYIVDRNSYEVIASKEVGTNPYYVISNNDYLFVTGMDSHDVSILDKKTFELRKVVDLQVGPYAMVIGGQIE